MGRMYSSMMERVPCAPLVEDELSTLSDCLCGLHSPLSAYVVDTSFQQQTSGRCRRMLYCSSGGHK
jgi:hypothetical protein